MMQLRLGSAGCDSQHYPYLLVLISLHVVQHEHLPCAVWEPGDRVLEVERQLDPRVAAGGTLEGVLPIVEALLLRAEGRAPGQDDVDREPVQPGPERRLAAERRELVPGPHEHVLGDLVGRVGTDHAPGETMDA